MKKITCLFFLWSCSIWAQQTKKVYFIGNSYTAVNNVPQLVANIAQTTNDVFVFQSTTPGGSTLKQHSENPEVVSTIHQGDWDYVVLQEQSQLPSFSPSQVNTQMLPYAQALSDEIKASNPCGTPLFYMTWGRKNGDAQNCPHLPYVCTYEGMDDKIRARYEQAATENEGILSPVGAVWRYIRQNHPDIELYSADESHPSLTGSLVAAYTFYTVIFKKDPTLATYTSGLNTADVTTIKTVVKNVVFNHLTDWYVGINDNPSRFSVHLVNDTTVQFTNQSGNATSFSWNFGDGSISSEPNPQHTFAGNGTYTVTLTTNACGQNTSFSQSVSLTALSNKEMVLKTVKMYPNPVSEFLYLDELPDTVISVNLFNHLGQQVNIIVNRDSNQAKIPVHQLNSGMYLLQLRTAKNQKTYPIIKK